MARNQFTSQIAFDLDEMDFTVPNITTQPYETRNITRHVPAQKVQGHWNPLQVQQPQQRGIWGHDWRLISRHPKQIDPNCWEVSRELNGRYTQYIQLSFSGIPEVRLFVFDAVSQRSVPNSFKRFSMDSARELKQMALRNPSKLQAIVLKDFLQYFTVR